MLEVVDVEKRLGGRRVLDRICLTCGPSEVCAVLGRNGAGKSTLLRVVAGMIEPDAGRVSVLGEPVTGGGTRARRHLGYVPDATDALPDLLVEEFVALVRALKDVPKDERAERELATWRERLELQSVWKQRLSSLSFGQRKRACTLAALVGDPWLLVLDEPSNGLDAAGSELLVELIATRRARGLATLLASNDLPFVEAVGARRYELRDGRIVEKGSGGEGSGRA